MGPFCKQVLKCVQDSDGSRLGLCNFVLCAEVFVDLSNDFAHSVNQSLVPTLNELFVSTVGYLNQYQGLVELVSDVPDTMFALANVASHHVGEHLELWRERILFVELDTIRQCYMEAAM